MRADDIRKTFLDFYRERGHRIFPSASLVPEDPTLLLTVAGMVPFKQYFTGERKMDPPRAASVQKCARTSDIENVGITARHQTLFEMMGNFSFGDYFKREAIEWAWELSLGSYGMEADRIWVTVFESDEEAARIWREVVGLPEERIIRRGAEDNFWWMGVAGPGGPCSELFYDRGPAYGPLESFEQAEQSERIVEYYNLVFTEFDVDGEGKPREPLPRRNVDTGGGLERTALILQEVPTAYETDLFMPIVKRAQELTQRPYGKHPKTDISLRILAEHARSAMFLIGDGVLPSNEGRGYVLRRLIRRAVRHAKLLDVDKPVMRGLVEASIDVMGDAYPESAQQRAFIEQVAAAEEDHFRGTLDRGLKLFDELVARMDLPKRKETTVSGDIAFRLHDTYGFPLELTLEIARDAGLGVDREGFERLMEGQRDRARSARKIGELGDTGLREVLVETGPTVFTGYEREAEEGKLLALVREGQRVEDAREGDEVEVVLDTTPFYPEGGGQVGDRGLIEVDGARLEVVDTQRVLGDLIVHAARVVRGEIAAGSAAVARVDPGHRSATMRSHTATHIVHAILRGALGDHARQAGSLVEPGRLRFDFMHFERVPRDLLDEVEATVNAHLLGDEAVRAYETTMDEARNRGAIMLFEEKYGDIVRVVEVGDYSVELCGGTHVIRTSQVGAVKVLGEASIGSNLRRIEALTGEEAIADFRRSRAVLEHIATLLKTTPEEAPARVERLLEELKKAEGEMKRARQAGERGRATEIAQQAERVGDADLVLQEVPGLRVDELQRLGLAVRESMRGKAAVVLASSVDGKAGIVAVVSKGSGIDPRALIADAARAIGGGAGGKGDVATGGGSNAAGVQDAIRIAREAAKRLLT